MKMETQSKYSKLIGIDKRYLKETYNVKDEKSYEEYLVMKKKENKEPMKELEEKEANNKIEMDMIQNPDKYKD